MTAAEDKHVVDAIVIGGGLIGLSAALALRESGMTVTVLEAISIARHASSASAGGVRSLNRHPAEIPLARAALPLWSTLAKQLGHACGFSVSGQLRIADNADALDALSARAAMTQSLGYHHEQLIGAGELHARIPSLARHCCGALLVADDGFADPLLTVHAYRLACLRAGVTLLEGIRVQAVEKDASGVRLHGCNLTSTLPGYVHPAEFSCTFCINAAGAWGGEISASAGEPVPIRPAALQMAVTEPVPHFVSSVVGCHGRKLSLKQTAAGAVVIGGGFEGQVSEDPYHGLHGTLSQPRVAQNLANAVALFPQLRHARVVRQWAGIEGMLPDSLPLLGPGMRIPGMIHAFGFSAHGFALVPVVGPLVADIARGRTVNLPISAFAVDRFGQHRSTQAA